jgi:hypothetical protein
MEYIVTLNNQNALTAIWRLDDSDDNRLDTMSKDSKPVQGLAA